MTKKKTESKGVIARGIIGKTFYDSKNNQATFKIALVNADQVREFYKNCGVEYSKRFTPTILEDEKCQEISLHTSYALTTYEKAANPEKLEPKEIGQLAEGQAVQVFLNVNQSLTGVYPYSIDFPEEPKTFKEFEAFNPFK